MKLIHIFLIVVLTTASSFSQSKQKCKVINEEIVGTYVGGCLNDLANGMGEFTFSDGKFVYQGNFKEGKMHGEGRIYSIENKKRKLVTKGNWQNNVYVGDKSQPYEVRRKTNLDRHTIRKTSDGENKVFINFYQNGIRNSVSNLNVAVSSGTRIAGNYTEGFDNVSYPFTCQVSYTTTNKFKAITYNVYFEVVINEPGLWEIFLYN